MLSKKQKGNPAHKVSLPQSLVLQDENLIATILQYERGNLLSHRQISKTFLSATGEAMHTLSFHPKSPRSAILSTLSQCSNLEVIMFDRVSAVDDELIIGIADRHPGLRYVGLCYCTKLTQNIINSKPPEMIFNIHGCWRIIRPHPHLTPYGVVEVQLLALQQGQQHSSEGLEVTFEFTSPLQRRDLSLNDIQGLSLNAGFKELVNMKYFRIRHIWEKNDKSFVLISVLPQNSSFIKYYVWSLTKQTEGLTKDCWMNNRVYVLNLPDFLANRL